jgi:hypothetical protein
MKSTNIARVCSPAVGGMSCPSLMISPRTAGKSVPYHKEVPMISLKVNGKSSRVELASDTALMGVIPVRLGLIGTK